MGYRTIRVSDATHERIKRLAASVAEATGMAPSMTNAIRYALKLTEAKLQEGAKP